MSTITKCNVCGRVVVDEADKDDWGWGIMEFSVNITKKDRERIDLCKEHAVKAAKAINKLFSKEKKA